MLMKQEEINNNINYHDNSDWLLYNKQREQLKMYNSTVSGVPVMGGAGGRSERLAYVCYAMYS